MPEYPPLMSGQVSQLAMLETRQSLCEPLPPLSGCMRLRAVDFANL